MRTIIISLVMLVALNSRAQKGKSFPLIEGSNLNDKAMSVPGKNNKFSIVAIAYTRAAEDDLRMWLNPLYENFVSKDGVGEGYDINFVFIPVISGLKKIKQDFKASTDKGFWPYVMDTEKSDIKGVQKELGVQDNKIAYFYVLDKEGKILDVQTGKFNQSKMEKMEEAIDK